MIVGVKHTNKYIHNGQVCVFARLLFTSCNIVACAAYLAMLVAHVERTHAYKLLNALHSPTPLPGHPIWHG